MLDWDFRKWAAQNGLTEFGTRIFDITSGIIKSNEGKSANKAVRRNTVGSTRRLCARCSKSLTIDCPVKNCLCTRTALTTVSSPCAVGNKGTSPLPTSSLTNTTPVKSGGGRRSRALTLCVSCISSSNIRRRLLRKPRNGGGRVLAVSSPSTSTNDPRSGASSPHSKASSPASNNSRGGSPPCEDFVSDSETSDEEDGKNLFNFR